MIGRTPNTFVVGAGPVATTLAGALRRKGVPVLGLWARNSKAARLAGSIAGVAAFSSAPPDLLLEAQVVIVAVSDDAIQDVASMLVGTGMVSSKHILLHCSGALSAEDAFFGVANKIGGAGILHPLRAISDPETVIPDIPGTIFGIQGDANGLRAASDLASVMGGQPLELSGDAMASYHAAAAMASNYVVALIDIGVELMTSAGMDQSVATTALAHLAGGAALNIKEQGIPEALTGPIRRGDASTVSRHLKVLKGEARAVYRGLGVRTLELARRLESAPSKELDRIESLLLSS